ncbi:hypothetical protein HYV12_00850 [Candidatus Dojkabacteria bacterium]|nr:hypothetical protein [Candidatus Dojkabacteria bacterium]
MHQLTRLIYRVVNYRLLIPFEGRVDVKVREGDRVSPGDVLFATSSKKMINSFYVPHELGVKIEECSDYIVRLNGEYILKGEVLAERMSAGGLSMKRLYAADDGVLSLSRIEKGFVDILSENQSEEFAFDSYGKISEIDLNSGLSVETMVWSMPMLTDNYHEKPNEYKNIKIGNFEVLGDGLSVYVKKDLKESYSGKIVFAGRFAYPDLLRELYSRGAEYVIVYSMDYLDFASLNFSVGVVGGFGNIPYPKEYLDIFQSLKGVFASVDLEKNTIIWPDHGKYIGKSPIAESNIFFSQLKPGMYVRTTDVDNYRAVGRVVDVNNEEHMVMIEFEDGRRFFVGEETLIPLHI